QVGGGGVVDVGAVVGGEVAQGDLAVHLAGGDDGHAQGREHIVVVHVADLATHPGLIDGDAFLPARQALKARHAEAGAEQIVEKEPPGEVDLPGPQGRHLPVDGGNHVALVVEQGIGGYRIAPQHVDGGVGGPIVPQ